MALVQIYFLFFGTLGLSIVLYRLSSAHPLSSVPGPYINKISKFYGSWVSASGKRHILQTALHEQYGSIVRTGPNEVSVLDVAGAKEALRLPRSRFYTQRSVHGLVNLAGSAHTPRRRRWERGMNAESLAEYDESLMVTTQKLLGYLNKSSGEAVDLCEWLNSFIYDFSVDIAFGEPMETLKEDKSRTAQFFHSIENGFKNMSVLGQTPWLFAFANKFAPRKHPMFGSELAQRRIARGTTKRDLFYHLIDEEVPEAKPPMREVIADCGLLVSVSLTTPSVLSCLFYSMLAQKQHYEAVKAEVDARDETLTAVVAANYPFTVACINEALRLYPPTPTSGQHEVPKGSGGQTICGQFLPEGTQVQVPLYAMHRRPEYFSPRPNDFVPERWLDGSLDLTKDAFMPFSYGPANCVGRNLAWREMLVVTVALMREFEMELPKGFDLDAWKDSFQDFYIATRPPLPVILRPRA
ncbi:cytochrome P450 [Cylindrobasidium torrendii FP15055 ss-10]|uniref:Cytochrome P450 n=1 Tax=Cylindrobasidium torrendii FP15055 ss-10 TaxID=1314674 RepID=A0A0D7BLX0_9AGAR|nr:cytochrome P450 [Cylindrobasidium torrendii FP15055 ss-10]